jgi:hypothetical protein
MANTAFRTVTNALYNKVVAPGHTFEVGNVLTFSTAAFTLAQGDTGPHSEVVGMVSAIETDAFYLTQAGYVSNITSPTPLVPGDQYYLSTTTPGLITNVKPNTLGEYLSPLFVAYTTTSGYFEAETGIEITNPATAFTWTVVNANTNMVANHGYIINGATALDMLLPASAAVGDVVRIATLGTNGCVITQNALQSLNMIDETSTIGVTGVTTLLATNGILSGTLEIICLTANTAFKSLSGTGVWDPT